MKLQDLTLQQLKEIVEGAPEGATHWNSNEKDDCWKYIKYDGADNYSLDDEGNWETSMEFHSHAKHGFLKLSDIRARIDELEPGFKVGDRVVRKSGYIDVFEIVEIDKHEIAHGHTDRGGVGYYLKDLRHATPEEIAAGHRIDEPSQMMTRESLLPPLRNKPVTFLNPLPDLTVGTDGYFHAQAQPDKITVKLDPAKCRSINAALPYDEPLTECELKSAMPRKHSHYFKDVSNLEKIDVYQVLRLFNVTDPCLQHIVKKALCAGQRGSKDYAKDVQEIADTANRLSDMEQGE